jgi:hypothetical protein
LADWQALQSRSTGSQYVATKRQKQPDHRRSDEPVPMADVRFSAHDCDRTVWLNLGDRAHTVGDPGSLVRRWFGCGDDKMMTTSVPRGSSRPGGAALYGPLRVVLDM